MRDLPIRPAPHRMRVAALDGEPVGNGVLRQGSARWRGEQNGRLIGGRHSRQAESRIPRPSLLPGLPSLCRVLAPRVYEIEQSLQLIHVRITQDVHRSFVGLDNGVVELLQQGHSTFRDLA